MRASQKILFSLLGGSLLVTACDREGPYQPPLDDPSKPEALSPIPVTSGLSEVPVIGSLSGPGPAVVEGGMSELDSSGIQESQLSALNGMNSGVIPAGGIDLPKRPFLDSGADGHQDILWRLRTAEKGHVALWEMEALTRRAVHDLPRVKNLDWNVVAVADFTADGVADIVWRNGSTGDNVIWEMDRTGYSNVHSLDRVINTDWEIKSAADFCGDATPDLVWRNVTTGDNVVWEMSGPAYVSVHPLERVPNTAWDIKGAGDLTGDGNPDLVWRYGVNGYGYNVVWQMAGCVKTAVQELEPVKNTDWALEAVGDLTGDGWPDFLWRLMATGKGDNVVWEMNGPNKVAVYPLPIVKNTDWHLAGIGDFLGAPSTGSLEVTTETTGEDLDPDGYTFQIDGGPSQWIGPNQTVSISDVEAGERSVYLDPATVALNCAITPPNPITATVPEGGTASASFGVICGAIVTTGSLEITTTTLGDAPFDPDGYEFQVNGGPSQAIGVNDLVTLKDLPPGQYSIFLNPASLAPQCYIDSNNPDIETVVAGNESDAGFVVRCEYGAPTRIEITPPYSPIQVGNTQQLSATAIDEYGLEDPDPTVTWTPINPSVASVTATGLALGLVEGATWIRAEAGGVTGEAMLAVRSGTGLYATAFHNGEFQSAVSRGQGVSIPVALDMSNVSGTGDLGAAEFELLYDDAVLTFSSSGQGDVGYAEINGSVPGRVAVALASNDPHGDANLTLVTLHFLVRADATLGISPLELVFGRSPVDTGFNPYPIPLAIGGRLEVGS